jgi:hypothetical protein
MARERRARAEIARIRRRAAEGKLVPYESYKEEQMSRIIETKHAIWRADCQVASRCICADVEAARAALKAHFAPILAFDWAGYAPADNSKRIVKGETP